MCFVRGSTMEKRLFFASIICLAYIQDSSTINTESQRYLSLPVDCSNEDVYPWFEGWNKYIQCKETKATIQNCPGKSNSGEKLNVICPANINERNFGYINCVKSTTKVVAFRSPNKSETPFYGICVNGIIIFQGRCTTDNDTVPMNYDEDKGLCVPPCNEGDIIEHPGCSEWSECVGGEIIKHECPPEAFFNGTDCDFNYRCPSNNPLITNTLPTTTSISTIPVPVITTTSPRPFRRVTRTTPKRF